MVVKESDDGMQKFMREMRGVRNSAIGGDEANSGLVRGKRTGVKVERMRVKKDSIGLDDVDSFWDNAVSNTTTPHSETSMSAYSSDFSSARFSPSESSTGLSPDRSTFMQDQYSSEDDVVHMNRSAAIRRRLKMGGDTPKILQQDTDEVSTDEEVTDFTAPSPGPALGKKKRKIQTPRVRQVDSPASLSPERAPSSRTTRSERRSSGKAYVVDSDFSTPRESEGEGSEGGGESVSSEKRILRNSSVRKTPQGRRLSRTSSSKKRPQPFNATDTEFQHGVEEEEEVVNFGDNYNDDDNEFEDVMTVDEEEHEGSRPFVREKGEAGSNSSGKDHSKKEKKSENKADVLLKPKQLKAGRKAPTQSKGALARKAMSKDNKGGVKMHIVPLKDLNEKGPKPPGVRRSSRAQVEPIKWWKNEHAMYTKPKTIEDVPSIYAVEIAPPTPMVQRKRPDMRHRKQHKNDKSMRNQSAELELLRDEEMPLIKGKRMKTQETCVVWDDEAGGIETKQIIKRYSSMAHKKLKASTMRPKGMEGTGSAAQCFNSRPAEGIGHWISGSLVLPPKATKDAEHVSVSTQLYWITKGQPGSIELSLAMPHGKSSIDGIFHPDAAQRYLLSPGDHFLIPSNNIYRIENLSSKADVHICWLILKPLAKPQA